MGAELSHHLGYAPGEAQPDDTANHQTRPLEPLYPVVFFDAWRVKTRDDGVVRSQAVYLALGVLADGTRDVLGVWIEQTEGAKFWMKVFTELKARGCEAVYPVTTRQTCLVHLMRQSLDLASWKERKALAAALRPIYTAQRADAAAEALAGFETGPGGSGFRRSARGGNITAEWRRPAHHWRAALNQFAILYEDRFTKALA